MREDCGKCGEPKQSTIHDTQSKNMEIRMGAHPWEPDTYVAYLRFADDGTIKVCDSDHPKAFKVWRRPSTMRP